MICTNPHAWRSLLQVSQTICLNYSVSRHLFDDDTHVFLLIAAYGQFLKANGEQPVTWKRASSMDEVLQEADVVRFFLFFLRK